MSPSHFAMIVWAEIDRLFRRPVAIAGLILSLLFGLAMPSIMGLVNAWILAPAISFAQQTANGPAPPGTTPGYLTWEAAIYGAYYIRNFLFVPILIFLLSGMSMASEFVSRTIREDVLRPIHRFELFLAKWLAIVGWVLALSACLALTSGLGGLLILGGFQLDQDALTGVESATLWGQIWAYIAYVWNPLSVPVQTAATTLMTDLGFATVALAIAAWTRSVAATVASMVMLFVLQLMLSLGLAVATSSMTQQAIAYQAPWVDQATLDTLFEWARWVQTWQPPFVIGNCAAVSVPSWESFATLGFITLLALAMGVIRMETMDVP